MFRIFSIFYSSGVARGKGVKTIAYLDETNKTFV